MKKLIFMLLLAAGVSACGDYNRNSSSNVAPDYTPVVTKTPTPEPMFTQSPKPTVKPTSVVADN